MYDALVVLRTGWGERELATVSPDLDLAVRAAIYAERLVPALHALDEVLATKPEDAPPGKRPAINKARLTASETRAEYRRLLRLEDD